MVTDTGIIGIIFSDSDALIGMSLLTLNPI